MAKYTLEQLHAAETLPCTKCEGTGNSRSNASRPCPYCDGRGRFHRPDVTFLIDQIKGRKPGTLRSKRPDQDRAYYVWRMARFHGGADTCLPMTASFAVTGDPYVPYLDVVADKVAKAVYRTSLAGSMRWAGALGYGVVPEPGLPPSAMPGGPVVTDTHKPYAEQLELV
jgi:hypothetical protein